MTKRRATNEDYAAMAESYETDPPGLDEVTSVEINPAVLRTGRPAGKHAPKGNTPTVVVRLPEPIRSEIDNRVNAGESSSASELIRQAVVEYFDNHPANAS